MADIITRHLLLTGILLLAVGVLSAQTAEDPGVPPIVPRPTEDDRPRSIREALVKRNIEKSRKDHEAMVKRGEEAAELVASLANSYENKQVLSAQDKRDLASLERLVRRIRSDLGGRDDGNKEVSFGTNEGGDEDDEDDVDTQNSPSDLKQAFSYLKNKTEELVEELRKSSRFSISATAIKSTNSVIRLARFLRAF